MASALVDILSKAQQEVPDFLAAFGSGGGAGGMDGGTFGATDIRGGAAAAGRNINSMFLVAFYNLICLEGKCTAHRGHSES